MQTLGWLTSAGAETTYTMRRHKAKKPSESVGWGNEALPKHERL